MADSFSNEPIPTDHLPQLADDAFVSVDPRYVRVSVAGIALTATLVVIGTALVAMRAAEKLPPVLVGGGILLLLVLTAVVRVLEVKRLAYQLREHDLSLRSGVITHRVESLPFSRVQHVNVHRGPIERSLGLATLEVSSAGPDITIPGLAQADAERIKLLVTERADVLDADTDGDADGDAGVWNDAAGNGAGQPPPAAGSMLQPPSLGAAPPVDRPPPPPPQR